MEIQEDRDVQGLMDRRVLKTLDLLFVREGLAIYGHAQWVTHIVFREMLAHLVVL